MSNETIFAFVAGAAIGTITTWSLLKTKYEKLAQEEIDSVKEVYSKKYEDLKSESKKVLPEQSEVKPKTQNYHSILNNLGYTEEKEEDKDIKETEEVAVNSPYIIPPEEFGIDDDYTVVSLTYYADDVLTDENDEPIEDIDDVVGLDSLNHIGDYEPDAIHVRNDKYKTDYEILRSQMTYLEATRPLR